MGSESIENAFQVCNQCRIKKIRCDREKPSCGNCSRSKQCCEWSGLGKKGNQITMLSQTISGMSSRLQEVEAAMLEFQRSLKRSRQASNNSSPVFSRQESDGEVPPVQDQICQLPTPANSSTTKPLFARPAGRLVGDRDGTLGPAYFGPTSLESLMLDFGDSSSNRIDLETQEYRDAGLTVHGRIKSFVNSKCDRHLSRPASLTEPPLVILECMVQPYFSHVNPHFPIWSRDGFQKMFTSFRQHCMCPGDEWASIVCCNNLILINLTADMIQSVQRKSMQAGASENVPSMTLDLIAGFLCNSKRAIENLGLLSPRLINLQALLSLCIVAQHYLPIHVLDLLFAQAVRCAEAMGIFQWHRLRDRLTESEFGDYKNIAHCLYILDKQICWTASVAPRVLKSDIQLDTTLADESFSRTLAAKAELAVIEEDIFLQVYAGHARARTEDDSRDVVESINQRLDDWLVQSGVDVEMTSRQPESCPVQAALLFSSLCAKLLLVWPFREQSHNFFQQHYSIAATCVRILISLWQSRADGGGQHVSVPLLITSYPPLYLLELSSQILTSNNNNNPDKASLRNVSKLLTAIVGARRDLSYTKRVEELSSVLMDTVTTSGAAAAKRRRTTSSIDCLSRPSSSYHIAYRDQQQQQQQQPLPKQMATPTSTDGRSLMNAGTGSTSIPQDQEYPLPGEFPFPHLADPSKSKLHHMARDSGLQDQYHQNIATTYDQLGVGLEEQYNEELFSYLASMD